MKKVIACVILTAFLMTGCQSAVEEGTRQLEEHEYTDAVSSFKEALEKKKDVAEAYRGLGMVYYEQQDYQSARDAFQQVLNNKGDATPALYNLMGICSMHMEDYHSALDALSQGLALAAEQADDKDSGAQDVETLVQEMKFNEIVCYEKILDWESAKQKMAEYASAYPDDKEAQKEAAFLKTR
ncbi:MAG: tetratricopeptide repeat protein [Muricomes sp.]